MSEVNMLAQRAYEITRQRLERFGNVLNEQHQNAIQRVNREMAEIALTRKPTRTAFSLGTGMGKTTSVIGFIAAVHELRLDISIAVSAEQVEALCELKRDLEAAGVPPDKIGLVHTYKYDPEWDSDRRLKPQHASESSTPLGDVKYKQFALITHNRVKSTSSGINAYYNYQAKGSSIPKQRDLVIWDESLMVSESRSLVWTEVVGKIAEFEARYEELVRNGRQPKAHHTALRDYLVRVRASVQEQLDHARQEPFALPDPGLEVLQFGAALEGMYGRKAPDQIHKLLKFADTGKVKAVKVDHSTLIQYEIVVPPELNRMVILDASYPIRELVRMDSSITWDRKHNDLRADYSNVEIRYWSERAGRKAIERHFAAPTNRLADEIVHLVRSIRRNNPGDPILIFTYKHQAKLGGPDIPKLINSELRNADITPDDKLINIATWGQEKATNKFAMCKHVIFAGVMFLPNHAVAAKISGQIQDDSFYVDQAKVLEVQASEQTHLIYQALSRGNCRHVHNGMAGTMSVYLFHHNLAPIRMQLDKAMPGARWILREPEHMKGKPSRKQSLAIKLANYLKQHSGDKIAVRKLRVEDEFEESDDVWKEAKGLVQLLTAGEWNHQERSFVRC